MVKASATSTEGKHLVVLGVTRGNLTRLVNGDPILVKVSEEMGKPADEVYIIFGETEKDLYDIVKRFITPETKVTVDPRLEGITT